MAEKVRVGGESSSDESFVAYVFESQSGLQAYQFEPRRITERQGESSSPSMSSEESEGETAVEQQQEANRLADTATWCTCRCCNTTHLRRVKECRKQPLVENLLLRQMQVIITHELQLYLGDKNNLFPSSSL